MDNLKYWLADIFGNPAAIIILSTGFSLVLAYFLRSGGELCGL